MIHKLSGKVLDVEGASHKHDAKLIQWDYHGGPNQLFRVFGSPIKPMHSDLVLDVANGSLASGAPIILYTLHGGPNQLFRLEYVPDAPTGTPGVTSAAYRVVADHSGKVLDIEGASHENGAKLIQSDWHGGLNQLFELRDLRNYVGFSLEPRRSGKVLDVARASQDLGAQLIQWDWHGGPNQRFRL